MNRTVILLLLFCLASYSTSVLANYSLEIEDDANNQDNDELTLWAAAEAIDQLAHSNGANNGPGLTYTRWGSSTCPKASGTSLVYSGIVAGSWYSHAGGGSNYLCLPKTPKYSKYRRGVQGHSYLYGTEYEQPIYLGNGHNAQDHDVPCAVCDISGRTRQLMIPATDTCPQSFTKEYDGYLMSEHIGHHASMFICVDKAQEVLPNTGQNRNGALLYHVEASCRYSAFPCPPYNSEKELTCVVCTK